MKNIKFLVVVCSTFLLSACGTGKTVILEHPENCNFVTGLRITSKPDTANVPTEMKTNFETFLKEKLFEKGGFKENNDLTLVYRFIQLEEGNQFARWFLGGLGNAGEGALTVETSYFDRTGKQIGKIQSEGKIGSGFFGGSFNHALEQAADQIAAHTIKTFQNKPAR